MRVISFRTLTVVICAVVSFVACAGCSRNDAQQGVKPARISATKPYEFYFGPAPTATKGNCYAFVIYFPSANDSGTVVPFPFFTFDEPSMKKVALQRLVAGMGGTSYADEILQLFPGGTRLVSVAQRDGEVTANFSGELKSTAADSGKAPALYNAVALTLLQFRGVTRVRIQSEGSDLFPADAPPPAESAVAQPSAPRILNVVATKESAAAPVSEVDALFDRPVDIKQCQFETLEEARIEGTVYHSMFDMAAVLKPKNPEGLEAGTKVKVRWQVTDKAGRSASGEDVFPLELKVQ